MTLLKTVTIASLGIFAIPQSALALVAPSYPIGTINGTFSVDSNGAAAYMIPITVPPGTNGVAPELMLSYNSSQNNGYMGMGWTLNGISSITRCPYTLNRDSYTGSFRRVGVNLTDEDHFCLDGIKLIAVEGDYGKEGTIYHTEKETWTKIISRGQCGNGPCSFEAYNKDGAKLEFAPTANSRILATERTDGTVQVWGLAKYTELNGNYTQINYFNENGEYYPVSIDYTGNDRVEPKITPQRSVQFEYEARNDVTVSYVAGSKSKMTKRINHIKTFVNDQLALDYQFEYKYSGATEKSRLTQLKQCDAKAVCLPTSLFEWQGDQTPEWAFSNTQEVPNYSSNDSRSFFLSLDVTGDGKSNNLVNIFDSGGVAHFITYTYLAGQWKEEPIDFKTEGAFSDQWLPMDVNGDGKTDIVNVYKSRGKGYLRSYLAMDGGNWEIKDPSEFAAWEDTGQWLTLDVNGDGQVDLVNIYVSAGTERFVTYWATGNGNWLEAGNSFNTGLSPSNNNDDQWLPMDVNGNGMTDLVKVFASGTTHFWPFMTTGDGERWDTTNNSFDTRRNTNSYWLPMDVNGDGKADMVNVDSSEGSKRLFTYLTTGIGDWELVSEFDTRQHSTTSGQFFPLDVNGDGRADLVNVFDNVGLDAFSTYLNISTSTEGIIWQALEDDFTKEIYNADLQWLPMDIKGKGITNLVKINISGGKQFLSTYLSTPDQISDLVTSITNGLNGSTTIEYASLTGDDDIYRVGHDAVYPVRDVQNPMYVVKTYTNHDGLDGDGTHEYRYNYHYSGARTDVRGWDWLGFKTIKMTEVKMTEEAYGRNSMTTYLQDYPYNGNIEKSEAYDGEGNLLNRNASDYTLLTPYPGVNVVLVSEETMTHYTKGVLDYTLENKSHYDEYANLTLAEELGNIVETDDDVYSCARYINDDTQWRLGYMEQAKTTKTLAACEKFIKSDSASLIWDADNDALWEKIGYDSRMNVILEEKWYYNPLKPSELGKWVNTSFVVDGYGNRTESTDPLGNTTVIAYETNYHSFPQTITSAPNAQNVKLVTTEQYEPLFGTKTQTIDINGNITRYKVDGFGRPINTYGPNLSGKEALITKVTYATDSNGIYVKTQQRPAWDTDNLNDWYWEKNYLDGLEREYRTEKRGTSDETTLIELVEFNAEGHIGQQSLPYFKKDSPSWITKEYDVYNRLTLTTAPDETQEKIEYAQGGLEISKTYAYRTPDCRTETTFSNARDLVVKRVEANKLSTEYAYDKLDQLISLTTTSDSDFKPVNCPTTASDSDSDSDSRTVNLVYDSLKRVVSKETSNTGVDLLEYDDADNLLLRTDAEENRLGFSYDKLNRVLTKTSTVGSEVTRTTFTYDESSEGTSRNGNGNMTSVVTWPASGLPLQDWHYEFAYDAYDQLVRGQVSMAAGIYSYAIEYDPMKRMIKYTYPDGTTQVLDYADDSNIHTLAMQGETGSYVTYSDFNALGEVQNIAYKNGVNITRSHYPIAEELGKLKSIQVVSSQQNNKALFSKHYQWNKINAITAITDSLDPDQDESFGYHDDPNNPQMGFLTKAEGGYPTEDYRYKKLGNIEKKNTTQYNYQAGTDKLVNDSEGGSFSYYSNGNLQEKVSGGVTWQYHYDAEGKLTTTRKGEQSGHSFYDYTGNRIYHQPAGQSVKTYYVTPNYEITDFGNGKVEHTKYIEGLFGRAVAITKSGTDVASAIEYHNATTQAKLYGDTTIKTSSLFSFSSIGMVARDDINVNQLWFAMKYHVTSFLTHPDMAQWLNIAVSSVVLMAGLLLFLLLIVRGASEDSVIGKARSKTVWFLARKGWISTKKASLWQQTDRTEFARDNPYKAAVLPFIVAAFFCTYGTMTEAALVPGDNGAGYPVEGTSYFVQNHVNSTVSVTDSQGAKTANVAYGPFGEIDQTHSTGMDNFRPKFSGKEWDYDKQLYYFEARYYDPVLAQFTTPDPAQQYINPYLYASNSPQSHIDQNGELAFLIAVIVIGAVVGAYMGASAVNGGSMNPAKWDWKSGKTWAGLFGGAAIGAVSGAASAGLASSASLAVSIAGHALLGAVENAAFTAMGGGSLKEIGMSSATGAAGGAIGGAMAGSGVSKATSSVSKATSKATTETAETGLKGTLTAAKTALKGTMTAAKKTVTESKLGQFVSKVATKATTGKTGKAVSIAKGVLMDAAQNSASTALEGGSAKEILISGGVSGILGGLSSTQSQFQDAYVLKKKGGVYSLTEAAKKSDKSVINGKYTYHPDK